MKAAVYRGIEDIRIEEYPDPVCGEDNVILRVKACAVCGTDVRTYYHGKSNVKPPQIIGHEIAGIIEKAGKNVRGFEEGDRVAVAAVVSCGKCHYCAKGRENLCLDFSAIGYEHQGGFAPLMPVPARMLEDGSVNRIPEGLSFEEASIAEPFACAINGQELSNVSDAETVVIIGAGPIGCMHTGLARAAGAGRVIVSDLSPERLETARSFGADECVNPEEEDLERKVMDISGGRGADVIIIAAPAKKAQENSLSYAAPYARINFFGGLPKDDPFVSLDSNLIHYKELFVHGTSGSLPSHNRKALELFSGGKVDARAIISETMPLDRLTEAIEKIRRGEGMKIVINP